MIDTSEDDDNLVRVRAQVMSRDDSSGGWVPLGGGGLSYVSVRKRPKPCPPSASEQQQDVSAPIKQSHEYLIFGERISDESVVLSCVIKRDFEYNKVMPTFHHWKTDDKKFGLTFRTAADARAFDMGVRTAVTELLAGFSGTTPTPFPKFPKDAGDDEVFMTLNLPQELEDSRSSSDSSTKGTDYLHRLTYHTVKDKTQPQAPRQPIFEPIKGDRGDNYSYVQLVLHDYNYPFLEDRQPCGVHLDSKKGIGAADAARPPPTLPPKKPTTARTQRTTRAQQAAMALQAVRTQPVRCKYCNELFYEDTNACGQCEYGPDCCRSVIDAITCIGCVRCLCYHCAADEEGEFATEPCDCSSAGDNDSCARRWLCLTFLSLFVPCLCFYPAFKMCHWCGKRAGVCGARHSA